mgnify:FL=1
MSDEIKKYNVGDHLLVTVTSIQPYGAFCSIDGGGSGLIHISEIDNKFIKNIASYLPLNSKHEVVVTKVLERPNTYAFSLKKANISNKRKRQNKVKYEKPLTRKQHNLEILLSYPFNDMKNVLNSMINSEYIRLTGGKK